MRALYAFRAIGAIILLTAAGAFLCLLLAVALYGAVLILGEQVTRRPVHEVTTPLKAEVVQDVCQALALPETDPLCKPGAVVYAPDFFPRIHKAFKPGVTTYDEIQKKLGKYQWKCEDPVYYPSLGKTFFRCDYALNEDHVFPFSFSFTEDGVLDKIFADGGGAW